MPFSTILAVLFAGLNAGHSLTLAYLMHRSVAQANLPQGRTVKLLAFLNGSPEYRDTGENETSWGSIVAVAAIVIGATLVLVALSEERISISPQVTTDR